MEHNANQERMREIEIFGIPALFSPNRIDTEDVYPGLHRYELMSGPLSRTAPGRSPRTRARNSWARYSPRC